MFSIFASLRLPAYSDFLQKKQRLHHPLSVNDAADLSLHRVTVLDSGFATLCFHKCALIGVILSVLGSLVNRLYPDLGCLVSCLQIIYYPEIISLAVHIKFMYLINFLVINRYVTNVRIICDAPCRNCFLFLLYTGFKCVKHAL